jgi:AcrR family transcriptional regulator
VTTIEDIAKESGISRATIYRHFPGGRDALLRAAVGREMDRFFLGLAAAAEGAPDFVHALATGLVYARHEILNHTVLQRMLRHEPDRLLPLLTVESNRVTPLITAYLAPLLTAERADGRLRANVDIDEAAEYLARLLVSLIGNPGSIDFDDPAAVDRLVRAELLGGILRPLTMRHLLP